MAVPGVHSLLPRWVGGGGAAARAATSAPEVVPLPDPLVRTTALLLARMLRRLPPSLWDTDPTADTLQRDLYRAYATPMAAWLAQRDIARMMTLLLEAEGIDLGTLLEDYGLRRYLDRDDAHARQIGMHSLWTPKNTQYSAHILADLLFDLPHVTLRTGRGHQHVFVATTHAVTTPYSYWGLISTDARWYAVTVDGAAVEGAVPTISEAPPPGLDLSPGPHALSWFTVLDNLGATWYVTIEHDTFCLAQTEPVGLGYGTLEPFRTLDGAGHLWGLAVRASDQVLLPVLLPPPPALRTADTARMVPLRIAPGPTGASAPVVSLAETGLPWYWLLRSAELGTAYALYMEALVPTVTIAPPAGGSAQTPGGVALDWLLLRDELNAVWYGHLVGDTLMIQQAVPSAGTIASTSVVELPDQDGQVWTMRVSAREEALLVTPVAPPTPLPPPTTGPLLVVAPGAPFQALQLYDAIGAPWWLWINAGAVVATATLPPGAVDATPAGRPYRWWRLYDRDGTLWYAYPTTAGVLVVQVVTPGGPGTAVPQSLGDAEGVLWYVAVDSDGTLRASDTPPVDYETRATAICLRDPLGARWFWRVHGGVLEWSPVLWPDTIDQSPWGDLGWFQILNDVGAVRYVSPIAWVGSPICTSGPPPALPWGWPHPFAFLDLDGTRWHLTALPEDDRLGLTTDPADTMPLPRTAVRMGEALEAFRHVQAAGCHLTLLIA